MAYKRKRFSRNYSRKRRRTMRRKYSRVPRSVQTGNTHTFKRVAEASSIVMNWDNQTCRTYAFTLNDLPNVQGFVALYDQYRVSKVKVEIVPNFTSLDGGFIPIAKTYAGALGGWGQRGGGDRPAALGLAWASKKGAAGPVWPGRTVPETSWCPQFCDRSEGRLSPGGPPGTPALGTPWPGNNPAGSNGAGPPSGQGNPNDNFTFVVINPRPTTCGTLT